MLKLCFFLLFHFSIWNGNNISCYCKIYLSDNSGVLLILLPHCKQRWSKTIKVHLFQWRSLLWTYLLWGFVQFSFHLWNRYCIPVFTQSKAESGVNRVKARQKTLLSGVFLLLAKYFYSVFVLIWSRAQSVYVDHSTMLLHADLHTLCVGIA